MFNPEIIAKNINKQIKIWQKNHSRLIVAIDGYSGSGKTTISDEIGKQNKDVLIMHLDAFIKHWKDRKKMIENTKTKSKVFEYNWYRYDELEKLIKAFKGGKESIKIKTYNYNKNDFNSGEVFNLNKKILVIDGIFLLHPKHEINKLWDKRIYLDIDFKEADKRRQIREKKLFKDKYLPESSKDNWIRYFKVAYRRYVKKYNMKAIADIVIKA